MSTPTPASSAVGETGPDADLREGLDNGVPRTAWRIGARNRARTVYAALLEAERGMVPLAPDDAALVRQAIWRGLVAACTTSAGRFRIHDWYSGAAIQTASSELHHASERLLLIQSADVVAGRIGEIDAELRSNLLQDDPRLKPATDRLAELATPRKTAFDTAERQELRRYQEVANAASEAAIANVRSFRNLLIVIGAGIVVVLLVLGFVHALAPDFLDLAEHSAGHHADAAEVWQIALIGAVGGMVAAVFTISKLGGFSGPYRLPVYQALIRIPSGALVALTAVVLTQSGQIQAIGAQSGLSILAIALLFGYAPNILLRFMDQRALTLLGHAQTKNDATRPPLTKPAA